MRKFYYITAFIIILLVSFLGITYSFEYGNSDNLDFKLIGPTKLYIDVNTEYIEYGIKVIYNDVDVSNKVLIDSSQVNITKLGNYKVKYSFGDEYIYRDVIVIDKVAPVIKLVGGDEITILLGGNYQESGYIVTDNCDKGLEDKVVVSGKVDVNKEGTYTLTYEVVDNSANKGVATRKIIVKKPTITLDNNFSNRVSPTSYNATLYSNTIVRNKFTDNGIYYEGYVREYSDTYKIKLKSNDNSKLEYSYNMSKSKNNYYSGNLVLTSLQNGTYDLYVVSNKEERLMNKLDVFSKLARAKVGNKLVTISYDNDYVSLIIEDFVYQYDIVIDPGHGGKDTGAANGIIIEKDLNLKVSKYEKCRYESMGYKVYMVRYDDSYGEMIGSSSLDQLDRRGLTMGYYGAVSKIVYSNHHNASYDSTARGFEILVSNQITAEDLLPEKNLYNKWLKFYGINDDKIRMYSKDYDTAIVYSKENGEVYSNKNYYAVIRIPYELFNVKNIIYEPVFMSNPSDFNWYYSSGNWVKISEMKIEEYVKYLGGEYDPNNKRCI